MKFHRSENQSVRLKSFNTVVVVTVSEIINNKDDTSARFEITVPPGMHAMLKSLEHQGTPIGHMGTLIVTLNSTNWLVLDYGKITLGVTAPLFALSKEQHPQVSVVVYSDDIYSVKN